MPYYSVGRKEAVVDSTSLRLPYNTTSGGSTLQRGSFEIGFRTRLPSGDEVKEIALNVAEPYSWWMDYQSMKRRALAKDPDFDTSLLREDKGHTWTFEQFEVKNLESFTFGISGESYQLRNVIPYRSVSPVGWAQLPSSSIESWAALQYGRVAPVTSEFSLSTFMGELREGLPRMIPDMIRRANTLKGVGSDYLNLEFGWKPLISDLQGLSESLLQASFGLFRPLGAAHRKRERPLIESFNRQDLGSGNMQALVGNLGSPTSYNPFASTSIGFHGTGAVVQGTHVDQSSVRQWVEGEFVYIPKAGFDPGKYLDRFETLANVDLTPAVLWELSPWSWLVDWAAQIGSSLSAMEAGLSNRILSTYFYGMEDTKSSSTHSLVVTGNQSGRSHVGPRNFTTIMERRRRRRVRANPFGYTGSSSSTLSGQQMAILGALGLTRSK